MTGATPEAYTIKNMGSANREHLDQITTKMEQESPLLRVLREHAEVLRLRLVKPSKLIIDTGDIEDVKKAS